MTTKIAVIADIHGNSSALQAVLENIEKDPDIEHIYCLGDMIGIGHETNEVLELLYSRNDVSSIIGNHEEEFINILEGKRAENHGGERQHHEWLVSRMDKKFKSILFELPRFKEVELEGKNILFIHYHLDANQIFLPIDNEPSAEKLDKIYKNSSADVVCFGHHHPVHFFKTEHRIYLNPGSLGCNHKSLAQYAVLKITNQIDVELREVPYDNRNFLYMYGILNVPDKNFILKVFHGNQLFN